MTTVAAQTTVDDTAGGTALHTGDAGPSGSRMVVKNTDGTDAVALGPSGLTFANGYQLAAGDTVSLELAAGDELYGICDSAATAVVHVLKTGE